MKVIKAVKLAMVGLTLVGMVGCAAPGSGLKRPDNLTLIDSATVPKSNWSDALVMLNDQMGVEGMMDAAPNSPVGSGGLFVNEASTRSSNGLEMAIMTGSLGVGAAFGMLSSDTSNQMLNQHQVAYWVPAEKVNSAEEAVLWVQKSWYQVQEAAFAGTNAREPQMREAVRYPIGHRSMYASFADNRTGNRTQYEASASTQTVGDVTGEFYGPIFVMYEHDIRINASRMNLRHSELIQLLAKHLPETAMIFDRGVPHLRGYEEGAIWHRGERYTFIAKGL